MPTPPTRRSERKRAVNTRIADLDSSPTQRAQPPSRKRKASTHAPPRQRARARQPTPEEESPETFQDTDYETAADDDELPKDAEIIIPYLTTSNYPIAMERTNHNDRIDEIYGSNSVQAYAQIRGRHWTYYVKETKFTIGRDQAPDIDGRPPPQTVEIDLGESKVISRQHAVVWFGHDDHGQEDHSWHIKVTGRNGLKLDHEEVSQGKTRLIHSGIVINVAGTEMLFQMPGQETKIHQRYKDRAMGYDEQMNNGSAHDHLGNAHALPYYSLPTQLPGRAPYSACPPHGMSFASQPNIAPAPTTPARPVTPGPISPTPKTVTSNKKRSSKSPPSRKRMNGIMMESTEQIDYALDSSKEIKPSCSYASMITWAILSTPDQTLSLSGIYAWIKAHYAFYRTAQTGWQNSIRHNLSLSQSFYKVPRRPDEPGKGMKWAIDPTHREATLAAANKNASRGGGRVSSAPGTPAGGPSSSSGFLPAAPNGEGKTSPRSHTPPLSSYPPPQQESWTPTRGPQMPAPAYTPQMPAYAPTQGSLPVLSDETSPMPRRRMNGVLTAVDSSPTLTSGAWVHDAPIRTPAPRPHNLNVPQPNTARLPTSHMPESSPAPFWRFDNSTPAGPWPEISPMRTNGTGAGPAYPSSSPPPTANGLESPTRKPRPPIITSSQNGNSKPKDEDDDEDDIDITRGFTKISKFHEERSNRES